MYKGFRFLIIFFILIVSRIHAQEIDAYDDYIAVKDDTKYEIDVLGNDIYPVGVKIKIISYTNNTDLAYPPRVNNNKIEIESDDAGIEKIEYEICTGDKNEVCSRAILHVVVTDKNIYAANDVYIIDNTDTCNFKILKNDIKDNGVKLTITEQARYGTTYIKGKNLFYVPANLDFEVDTIKYKISKGGSQSQAFVYIYVKKNNKPKVADFEINIKEDESYHLKKNEFTNCFSDSDNDSLAKIKVTSVPIYGTLKFNSSILGPGDEISINDINKIIFIPDKDYYGTEIISWKGFDGNNFSENDAEIKIKIEPVNDPTEVSDFNVSTYEDKIYSFNEIDFTSSVYDPDHEKLEGVKINSLPAKGELILNDELLPDTTFLSVKLIEQLKYRPLKDWHGTDSFTWSAKCGSVFSQLEAKVNIDVLPVRDDLFVFKAFSPNGDNYNEVWIIEGIRDYESNHVKVFNRQGLLIYQQKNYNNNDKVWKGNTNVNHLNPEEIAPDDVYFYTIELGDNIKSMKGYIVIKR